MQMTMRIVAKRKRAESNSLLLEDHFRESLKTNAANCHLHLHVRLPRVEHFLISPADAHSRNLICCLMLKSAMALEMKVPSNGDQVMASGNGN